MKRLTWKQQKAVVQQWKRAAPALARAREEELAAWQYDAATVDALLDIGAKAPRKEEEPNGLVEMQRLFMKAARKQGLIPYAVREGPAPYGSEGLPSADTAAEGTLAPLRKFLYIVGDPAILNRPKVALFCSVKCPGKLILAAYDLAQSLRAAGVTVISGFHSPMEQECMRILIRSPNPVIWCLARGLYRQVPSTPVDCRPAVAEGRLIMVTPFPASLRHITAKTALLRNRLVADMASAVVVAHAAPGSKMEALCRDLLAAGKPLYTFDHPANAALIGYGASTIGKLELSALTKKSTT
ncbi:MAG: DNA-processing protein DprA [Lentisphaerae bacterium]|nr:DNA-processing protein DprA [Lentisphaerota bacterium]